MIVDASCTPADIRYPNDMSILNEARENTEAFIDFLYRAFLKGNYKKPRDYRYKAHSDFIDYTKRRKPRSSVRRKAITKQINYLRRNIGYLEDMLVSVYSLDLVDYDLMNLKILKKMQERFEVIKKVYDQQHYMLKNKVSKVENRIVSITQPHIRPIVRGKAGKNVEFGAKISMSVIDGFCFIDHLSWDNFNESMDLIGQIEKYREMFGYYPESVHADKIYQNRKNRGFCKDHDIRMTGKPLGRPPKETESNKEKLKMDRKQRYQDHIDRIIVEAKFGIGKRKYGMGLIKSKLKETSETDIHLTCLVMNLDKICDKEMAENKQKYSILMGQAA